MAVALTMVNSAGCVPNVTIVVPERLVPVILTPVPPVVLPDDVTEDIEGADAKL